jgi:glycine cleavage system H protein
MNVPSNLLYTREHEWLRAIDDTTAIVGITDYAQNSLGDITFVELPKAGRAFKAGETFGVVESVKAASDLFMPVEAEVIEANAALTAATETLYGDPYEKGWMLRLKIKDKAQLSTLLSPEAYERLTAG